MRRGRPAINILANAGRTEGDIEMTAKTCPNCGLFSVESALACDCGYHFLVPGQPIAAANAPEHVKQPIPRYPWLTIWYKPRGTIRAIVDNNPSYQVTILAALWGALGALEQASSEGLGDSMDWIGIFVAAFIFAPLAGLLGLYIGAAILSFISGKLKGEADSGEIRAVLAWSSIPLICHAILALLLSGILLGPELFNSSAPQFEARLASSPLLSFVFLAIVGLILAVGLLFRLWSFVIFLKGLSEVNRFSIWRALATSLIALSPILILAGCIIATLAVTV